jgi:hypothetical protein
MSFYKKFFRKFCVLSISFLAAFSVAALGARNFHEKKPPLWETKEYIIHTLTYLLKTPGFDRIDGLSLRACTLSSQDLQLLAKFPFTQLKTLILPMKGITFQQFQQFVQAPWFKKLKVIKIQLRPSIEPFVEHPKLSKEDKKNVVKEFNQGLELLAKTPFEDLQKLSFDMHELGNILSWQNTRLNGRRRKDWVKLPEISWTQLYSAPWMKDLVEWNIGMGQRKPEILQHFMRIPFWRLRSLTSHTFFEESGVPFIQALLSNLARAPWIQNIEKLKIYEHAPYTRKYKSPAVMLAQIPFHKLKKLTAHLGMNDKDLTTLLKAPWMQHIEKLDITGNPLKGQAKEKLPVLPALKELRFGALYGMGDVGPEISDQWVISLLRSVPQLKTLRIMYYKDWPRILSRIKNMPHIEKLSVYMRFSMQDFQTLINTPWFQHITEFDVPFAFQNKLFIRKQLSVLAQAPLHLHQIPFFVADVESKELSQEDVEEFFLAPWVEQNLQVLGLPKIKRPYTNLFFLMSLRHIKEFTFSPSFSRKNIKEAFALKWLAHVETLVLNDLKHIKPQELARYLAKIPFKNLKSLDLSYGKITDEGLALLAQTSWFSRLEKLYLGGNVLTKKGLHILARVPFTQLKELFIQPYERWSPRHAQHEKTDKNILTEKDLQILYQAPWFLNMNKFCPIP